MTSARGTALGLSVGPTAAAQASALRDLVAVAQRFRAREPGGDWPATQRALEAYYGKGKRMFVYRMVQSAIWLPEEVLEYLAKRGTPNSYIHENRYFMGQGKDGTKTLSTENRVKAVDMLADDMEVGRGLSPAVFVNEYCVPLKAAENWIRAKRKLYGVLADTPAFSRVAGYLTSSRARVAILACLRAGIRLEGVSAEQPGVPQCRALIAELDASREGRPAAASGAGRGRRMASLG